MVLLLLRLLAVLPHVSSEGDAHVVAKLESLESTVRELTAAVRQRHPGDRRAGASLCPGHMAVARLAALAHLIGPWTLWPKLL